MNDLKLRRLPRGTSKPDEMNWNDLIGSVPTSRCATRVIFRVVGCALALSGCSNSGPLDTPLPSSVVEIAAVSGDQQVGLVGQRLADPVVVQARGVDGSPSAGSRVTFSVVHGGGTVATASAITDADGEASTYWTLGSVLGEQRVEARAEETEDGQSLTATVRATGVTSLPPPDPGGPAPASGDTLFYDGFESGSLSAWSEVSETLARIVTGSGAASNGTGALELTVPAGHTGTWLTRFFGPGRDSVFVRFKVRFPADWTGNTKLLFVRGSLVDNLWSAWGTAGQCPDGSRWFQTGNATYQSGNPGVLNYYTYFPDMIREANGTTCWGNFGDPTTRYESMPAMAKEVWHTVEFWLRLNEPGARDGVQRMWVNGQLRANWTGFRFRTTRDVRINSITLHAYPDAPSSQVRRLRYDEILVTTRSPY